MKNIYLIERHQGDHDDYRVTPVKAFKEYYMAKEFIDKCNKDVKPMLNKMEEFNKKYDIGIWAFRDKCNNNTMDMLSDEEYQKWEEKKNDDYNEIIETFKHEELEFADTPIVYEMRQIELVKKDNKCPCGGYMNDWHSHASDCIVINKQGKQY